MLDQQILRNNLDALKDNLERRGLDIDIDFLVQQDEKKRAIKFEAEKARSEQKNIGKEISQSEGTKKEELLKKASVLSENVKLLNEKYDAEEKLFLEQWIKIPNLVDETSPTGATDQDNKEIKKVGEIKEIENRLPTEMDLTTHLSTIFTENRLKKYIELRSMDTCGWDCLCAGPAFNVGMLYGNLDEVYELISSWDKDKIINAYLEAPKKGFNTQLMGKDLLYWASTLLALSKKGLENRDVLNKHGKNETLFLNHLKKLIDNKTTNADHMISKFSNNEDLNELYDK